MSDQNKEFFYKLNAMENAAQSGQPAANGYSQKRIDVLNYVEGLQRDLTAERKRLDWFDTLPEHKLSRIRADVKEGLTVRVAIDAAMSSAAKG